MYSDQRFEQPESLPNRKLSEYRTLHNQLNRYWNKLVSEGLRMARDRKLVTGIVDSSVHIAFDVSIRRDGQDIDASELIELARERFPSLYRKYSEGMKRREFLQRELLTVLG